MNTSNNILYYPSIEFSDEDWIRRSLLYWDHIYRIVPESYDPNDSDFVKELVDNGLIRNINVSYETAQDVANSFLDIIESPNRPAGLSIDLRQEEISNEEYARLHSSKIYFVLEDLFRDMGFRNDGDGFIRISKSLAGYYMLVLARKIAAKRRMPIGTDSREIWAVTSYFAEKGNFAELEYQSDKIGMLSCVTLEDLFPETINGLAASDIIQISKDMTDQRKALRTKVGETLSRIEKINDNGQIQDELTDFLTDIERQKEELKKSSLIYRNASRMTSLVTSIATSASIYSGFGSNKLSLCAGLTLAAINFFAKERLVKKNRNPSYQSYLVGLDKRAVGSLPHFTQTSINEFIYD